MSDPAVEVVTPPGKVPQFVSTEKFIERAQIELEAFRNKSKKLFKKCSYLRLHLEMALKETLTKLFDVLSKEEAQADLSLPTLLTQLNTLGEITFSQYAYRFNKQKFYETSSGAPRYKQNIVNVLTPDAAIGQMTRLLRLDGSKLGAIKALARPNVNPQNDGVDRSRRIYSKKNKFFGNPQSKLFTFVPLDNRVICLRGDDVKSINAIRSSIPEVVDLILEQILKSENGLQKIKKIKQGLIGTLKDSKIEPNAYRILFIEIIAFQLDQLIKAETIKSTSWEKKSLQPAVSKTIVEQEVMYVYPKQQLETTGIHGFEHKLDPALLNPPPAGLRVYGPKIVVRPRKNHPKLPSLLFIKSKIEPLLNKESLRREPAPGGVWDLLYKHREYLWNKSYSSGSTQQARVPDWGQRREIHLYPTSSLELEQHYKSLESLLAQVKTLMPVPPEVLKFTLNFRYSRLVKKRFDFAVPQDPYVGLVRSIIKYCINFADSYSWPFVYKLLEDDRLPKNLVLSLVTKRVKSLFLDGNTLTRMETIISRINKPEELKPIEEILTANILLLSQIASNAPSAIIQNLSQDFISPKIISGSYPKRKNKKNKKTNAQGHSQNSGGSQDLTLAKGGWKAAFEECIFKQLVMLFIASNYDESAVRGMHSTLVNSKLFSLLSQSTESSEMKVEEQVPVQNRRAPKHYRLATDLSTARMRKKIDKKLISIQLKELISIDPIVLSKLSEDTSRWLLTLNDEPSPFCEDQLAPSDFEKAILQLSDDEIANKLMASSARKIVSYFGKADHTLSQEELRINFLSLLLESRDVSGVKTYNKDHYKKDFISTFILKSVFTLLETNGLEHHYTQAFLAKRLLQLMERAYNLDKSLIRNINYGLNSLFNSRMRTNHLKKLFGLNFYYFADKLYSNPDKKEFIESIIDGVHLNAGLALTKATFTQIGKLIDAEKVYKPNEFIELVRAACIKVFNTQNEYSKFNKEFTGYQFVRITLESLKPNEPVSEQTFTAVQVLKDCSPIRSLRVLDKLYPEHQVISNEDFRAYLKAKSRRKDFLPTELTMQALFDELDLGSSPEVLRKISRALADTPLQLFQICAKKYFKGDAKFLFLHSVIYNKSYSKLFTLLQNEGPVLFSLLTQEPPKELKELLEEDFIQSEGALKEKVLPTWYTGKSQYDDQGWVVEERPSDPREELPLYHPHLISTAITTPCPRTLYSLLAVHWIDLSTYIGQILLSCRGYVETDTGLKVDGRRVETLPGCLFTECFKAFAKNDEKVLRDFLAGVKTMDADVVFKTYGMFEKKSSKEDFLMMLNEISNRYFEKSITIRSRRRNRKYYKKQTPSPFENKKPNDKHETPHGAVLEAQLLKQLSRVSQTSRVTKKQLVDLYQIIQGPSAATKLQDMTDLTSLSRLVANISRVLLPKFVKNLPLPSQVKLSSVLANARLTVQEISELFDGRDSELRIDAYLHEIEKMLLSEDSARDGIEVFNAFDKNAFLIHKKIRSTGFDHGPLWDKECESFMNCMKLFLVKFAIMIYFIGYLNLGSKPDEKLKSDYISKVESFLVKVNPQYLQSALIILGLDLKEQREAWEQFCKDLSSKNKSLVSFNLTLESHVCMTEDHRNSKYPVCCLTKENDRLYSMLLRNYDLELSAKKVFEDGMYRLTEVLTDEAQSLKLCNQILKDCESKSPLHAVTCHHDIVYPRTPTQRDPFPLESHFKKILKKKPICAPEATLSFGLIKHYLLNSDKAATSSERLLALDALLNRRLRQVKEGLDNIIFYVPPCNNREDKVEKSKVKSNVLGSFGPRENPTREYKNMMSKAQVGTLVFYLKGEEEKVVEMEMAEENEKVQKDAKEKEDQKKDGRKGKERTVYYASAFVEVDPTLQHEREFTKIAFRLPNGEWKTLPLNRGAHSSYFELESLGQSLRLLTYQILDTFKPVVVHEAFSTNPPANLFQRKYLSTLGQMWDRKTYEFNHDVALSGKNPYNERSMRELSLYFKVQDVLKEYEQNYSYANHNIDLWQKLGLNLQQVLDSI
jgi:hypothetical protein